MIAIKISITKFISNDQPGFVECTFQDAWGKEHFIHEKIPVVTSKDLDANSIYLQEEELDCQIIRKWDDQDG